MHANDRVAGQVTDETDTAHSGAPCAMPEPGVSP
jgi:hypothetical protein